MAEIAIIDYGMGNLRSVQKKIQRLGSEAEITSNFVLSSTEPTLPLI